MKKKSVTHGEHLKPITLYSDDLDFIHEKILDTCSKIEYSTDRYEYDSLEELKKESSPKVDNLSISGRNPYISIDISKHRIWLYTSGENSDVVNLYYFFKDYLQKKGSIYSKIFNTWIWGIINAFFLPSGLLFLFSDYFLKKTPISSNKVLILGLSVLVIGLLISLIFYRKGSVIYLSSKNDTDSFFERNRDSIILLVLGAIIGWIFTMVSKIFV